MTALRINAMLDDWVECGFDFTRAVVTRGSELRRRVWVMQGTVRRQASNSVERVRIALIVAGEVMKVRVNL